MKETNMQRAFALVVALSLVVGFSGVALAGDFGECSYSSHVNRAATDKADTSQTVATKPAPKADADKLLLAFTDKQDKSTPPTKK
jgi:hypothetical protein